MCTSSAAYLQITADVVFQAQNASAKAIREARSSEASLRTLEGDAIALQGRMEKDLMWVEGMQTEEIRARVVKLVQLRAEASRAAAGTASSRVSRLLFPDI